VRFRCHDDHDTALHLESDVGCANHDAPVLTLLAILPARVSRAGVLCQSLLYQTLKAERTRCHEIVVWFNLVQTLLRIRVPGDFKTIFQWGRPVTSGFGRRLILGIFARSYGFARILNTAIIRFGVQTCLCPNLLRSYLIHQGLICYCDKKRSTQICWFYGVSGIDSVVPSTIFILRPFHFHFLGRCSMSCPPL